MKEIKIEQQPKISVEKVKALLSELEEKAALNKNDRELLQMKNISKKKE